MRCLLYHNKRLQGTTTSRSCPLLFPVLYHNKRLQGTTTGNLPYGSRSPLYHNKRLQGTTTRISGIRCGPLLYHNKRLQGTTTCRNLCEKAGVLYHNKRLQGTTTLVVALGAGLGLYHNKRLQGTTTSWRRSPYRTALYHNKRLQGTTTSETSCTNRCSGALWAVVSKDRKPGDSSMDCTTVSKEYAWNWFNTGRFQTFLSQLFGFLLRLPDGQYLSYPPPLTFPLRFAIIFSLTYICAERRRSG